MQDLDNALKLINADQDGNFLCNFGTVDLVKGKESIITYDSKFNGQATAEIEDDEGQIVIQQGLDWTPFMNKGVFKDAHPFRDDKGNIPYMPRTVAVPIDEKAWYDKSVNGWMVKGQFLPEVKEARDLVDLAKSYNAINMPRRLKFSIEGKIQKIDGNKIYKASVLNVVISEQVQNQATYLDILAKSLNLIKGVTSGSTGSFKPEDLEGHATLQVPPGLADYDKFRSSLINHLVKSYKMNKKLASKYVDQFIKKKTIAISGGKNV